MIFLDLLPNQAAESRKSGKNIPLRKNQQAAGVGGSQVVIPSPGDYNKGLASPVPAPTDWRPAMLRPNAITCLMALISATLVAVPLSAAKSAPLLAGWHPDEATNAAAVPAGDVARQIDELIARRLAEVGREPAPLTTDAEFARRVYLDLVGSLPTVPQLEAFLADASPQKRAELLERLLSSPEHSRHFAQVFDTMLMGRRDRKLGERRKHGWYDYLESIFAENRPWDQVVQEMLLARAEGERRGHLWYLYERENNHQAIAESVAKSFFGVDIACAQCHDHLVAEEIKQAHYWGLVGFFKRSTNAQTERGIAIAESAIGGFDDYANPLLGTTESLELTFLLRGTVEEARPEDPAKQEDAESFYVAIEGEPKVPKFSRREKFVTEILADHPLLARSMVNRLWGLLLGRGLVHPIERMDSTNPPSHPELLDFLSEDFRQHGYDLRRLIRSLVLSDTYQRSSQAGPGSVTEALFAHGLVKPLTAEVYLDAVRVALGPQVEAGQEDPWRKLAGSWRKLFPEVVATGDQATIDQALGLANGPEFHVALQRAAERWVQEQSERTLEQQIDAIYQRCFGRAPEADELTVVRDYLVARGERPLEGWAQVFWTLVTAPEFRFNH